MVYKKLELNDKELKEISGGRVPDRAVTVEVPFGALLNILSSPAGVNAPVMFTSG